MGRTLKEMIASLPKARRRAIKKRTAALIAARRKSNPHVGSDFEDFLADEGRLAGIHRARDQAGAGGVGEGT